MKDTKQPFGHSEALAVVNVKLYAESGADILLTLREGVTPQQAQGLLDTLAQTLTYAKDKYHLSTTPEPAPVAAPPAAGSGQQPPAPPVAPPLANGNGHPAPVAPPAALSFEAQALAVAIDESGKMLFKVKGGKFSRWGLRIWPEVLAAAGFEVSALQPGQTYSLAGYSADYILGDNGKPLKVTELAAH